MIMPQLKGILTALIKKKKTGGVMLGMLNVNGQELSGINDIPKYGYSAVSKNYVTTQLNTKLDKAADIDMKNKKNFPDN